MLEGARGVSGDGWGSFLDILLSLQRQVVVGQGMLLLPFALPAPAWPVLPALFALQPSSVCKQLVNTT
jgi:hypothetical protein